MELRIGTADAGGTFDTQGEALADILREKEGLRSVAVVRTPNASIDNANALHAGRIEFGFMASNWVGRAFAGKDPFREPIALRIASPANAGPLFFVALASSGIASFEDFPGKRICLGPEGSGMTRHAHVIFDVLGLSLDVFEPVYLGFADGAEALISGEIDVQFQCPVPNAVMTALSKRAEVRVIEAGEDNLRRLVAAVPFYRRTVMPKGVFRGVAADSAQIAVLNVIATHARVDDDAVAALVRTMVANTEQLAEANPLYRGLGALFAPLKTDGARALEFGGVPLHPGAIAAYRDAGYLA